MSKSERKNPTQTCKLTKRPLGKLLLDGEFILPQDIEQALEEQRHTNEHLGKILVLMGVLHPADLNVVLSIQRDLMSPEKAIKLAAGLRQLLGELLIQAKRLTPEQLEDVLQEHRRTGKKLGEVLVRLGVLSEQELDRVLTFQQHQSDTFRAARLRLGQLLVATNQITQEQLEDALKRQQLSPHKKIGELLVEAGYVTPEQVTLGVKLQRKLLTAALVAILSLSSPISPVIENSEATSSAVQTSVNEVFEAHATLKVLYQVPELVVTHADILRGYVEVKSASRIEIRSNVFFFLRFIGLREPFEKVYIRGFGRDVLIGPRESSLFLPDIRGFATFDLSYKFFLSKDAQPGTYSWPLEISAHPTMKA